MRVWKCSNCDHILDGDRPGVPCPQCGQTARTTAQINEVSTTPLPSLDAKKRDPTFPSKKRVRVHLFQGWDVRRSIGDMVKKLRRIDKDADTYLEHVEDKDGKIIHHVEEPLSEHRGHGSAKSSTSPSSD